MLGGAGGQVEGHFVRQARLQANADGIPDRRFVGFQTGQQFGLGALAPGELRVTASDGWEAVWHVTGPRKDQTLTTRYDRTG